jgi:prolipoprotein diacylglyceryl transferase
VILASIPSPPTGVWHLGSVPIRAYALCIIAGILVAVAISDRRLRARGFRPGLAADIATWAVPFGLVGARLYNVVTDPELYWGRTGQGWVATFEIWHGGLGIWGAIAGGALGAYLAARRYHVPYDVYADASAPGIAVAQAIGRWGNYFNQELYGRPSGLPWALHITHPADGGVPGYYQPTFLYESLWDLAVAVLVIWAGRRWGLGRGRVFALYVMAYTAGRAWIEALRIDYAHTFLGLRLNDWTSIVVFLAALVFFVVRRNPAPGEQSGKDVAEPAPAGGSGDDPARSLQS